MKWSIPAKTFLLGEYAAVAQESAIILTTTPYFDVHLTPEAGLKDIHPLSPAGLWWKQQSTSQGLSWHDPYSGCGGLGASSAQFLGSYLASTLIQQKTPNISDLLNTYYQSAWTGEGLRPSGYDLIAQTQGGCVYINKNKDLRQSYDWVFNDLSLFLIHTGIKLATHEHLKTTPLPQDIDALSHLVDEAKRAFDFKKSQLLVKCINGYHEQLQALGLIAPHSLELINKIKNYPEVLAIKGCGALGSDILLVISPKNTAHSLQLKLQAQHSPIIATQAQISKKIPLLS